MNNPRVTILRGRETDPAILKYCRALSKNNYPVTLLIWNRRGSAKDLPKVAENFSEVQFFFRAPLDKFSAVLFYPVWWIYIVYFLLKEKPDIVHACDFDTLIPVMALRTFRTFRFVYTIFDFYANNIQGTDSSPVRRLLKKLVKATDFRGINSSDLLILADESRAEEIAGTTVKNLIFIYNTPEDQHFAAVPHPNAPGTGVSLFFAGLLMNFRGIKDMITAVSLVPEAKLILAGPLIDTDSLDGISAYGDRISYIGWIPSYREVLEKTMEADILFRFSDPKHPKTRYESPNKLFEAMMCGKPIIVSDESAMATIVRQNNCGLVIPYGDIEAIKAAITTLVSDPNLRKELGNNGRKAYEQKYSWTIMENRLIAGYEKINI